MTAEIPDEPKNREEQYLARIAGQNTPLPADGPRNRIEMYLNAIVENGGGGGGGGGDSGIKKLTNSDANYSIDEVEYIAIFNLQSGRYRLAENATIPVLLNVNDPLGTISAGYQFNANTQPLITVFNDEDDLASDIVASVLNSDGLVEAMLGRNGLLNDYAAFPIADFRGTDGSHDGVAGLVPAPTAMDTDTFLKSDGSWAAVGGGGGGDSVYSTVTTSAAANGGAVYIGDKNASQEVQADPTTTDNNYKYFWALPYNTTGKPGNNSINVLGNPFSNRNNNVTLGSESKSEDGAIAIGREAFAAANSVALGYLANNDINASFNNYSANIAIGYHTKSASNHSVALGDFAAVNADYSVALGSGTEIWTTGSVALGKGAYPERNGEVNIGADSTAYGFDNTNERVIGGVHDGERLTDAATVAQGNTLAASAPTTSTVGVLGQLYTDTTNMHTYQCTAIAGDTYTWTQRW